MILSLPPRLELQNIGELLPQIEEKLALLDEGQELTLDFAKVEHLEVSGVGLLICCSQQSLQQKKALKFVNISSTIEPLLQFSEVTPSPPTLPLKNKSFFTKLGKAVVQNCLSVLDFFEFFGRASTELFKEFLKPHQIRWKDTCYYLETAGLQALPIIGLISFLMGMIIAFQSAAQLKQFGANIFVVELVSITMLRELAPLMTSILVAGRSGASFTAEIGTMQTSEEIDAMKVIGLNLIEYLVAPKFWALMIALPLLAFWADLLGVIGGAMIAYWSLDIPYYVFFTRLQQEVPLRHALIGLGKCFVFAAVISLMGCYRGMKVTSGAGSVGQQTTASVVSSIFFVIIADAIFSILFTIIGI